MLLKFNSINRTSKPVVIQMGNDSLQSNKMHAALQQLSWYLGNFGSTEFRNPGGHFHLKDNFGI